MYKTEYKLAYGNFEDFESHINELSEEGYSTVGSIQMLERGDEMHFSVLMTRTINTEYESPK